MRKFAFVSLLLFTFHLHSRSSAPIEVDPWRSHIGLMAGMNTSVLQMSGGFASSENSSVQWTPAFGIYFKSNVKNMLRIEVQTGFETAGAGREYFYQRNSTEFVRIYDRYRTIPVAMLLNRNLGWKETFSVGLGFKSSFIVNYTTRHVGHLSQSGIILTPEIRRWYGSPVLQLSANFQFAEVALNGWYALSPVISQYGVKASPFGVTFLVKARIMQM